MEQVIYENTRWDLIKVDSIDEITYKENTAYAIKVEGIRYIIPSYDSRYDDIEKPCVYLDADGNSVVNFDVNNKNLEERNMDEYATPMPTHISSIIAGDEMADRQFDVKENTDGDITFLEVYDDDNNFTKIIKEAINRKKVNIREQYSHRWENSTQFNNDWRSLRETRNTSLKKFITFAINLDIIAEIRLTDKPGAPNPMGEKLAFYINK